MNTIKMCHFSLDTLYNEQHGRFLTQKNKFFKELFMRALTGLCGICFP